MLQISTSVVAVENGSRKAVVESGTTSMSLSWISWKPRIDDPSKPMPSLMALASTALGGTEKCCQVPGKSVKRKSIIWTFLALMALRTSSAVEQLRNMIASVSNSGEASIRCGDAHLQALLTGSISAFVGPTHQLQRRFDVPPNFGVFFFAFHFESTSFLRGLDNCLGTMCFQ